jgi:GT2 family glycosyltransferase
LLTEALAQIESAPLISVVMPVFDPPVALLERAIGSVVDQIYPHWELCIADDASTNPQVRVALAEWAARDERIKTVRRAANGHISRATNTAVELAVGEYLAFLDHDDELAPDALAEVALALAAQPDLDVVYTDDDHIDLDGRRFSPQFKPAWSPELLLSYMYLGHLLVVRRRVYEQIGGTRTGFEGSQDHDLALRLSEVTSRVGHVPRILYHWRTSPGSTAHSGAEKPYSLTAGERAVREALERRGAAAEVRQHPWAARNGWAIFAHRYPDDGPRVAVLVLTRNRHDLLASCLKSLRKTSYRNWEVVIVDNDSDDPSTIEYLRRRSERVLRISTEGRFNFARLANEAVAAVEADCVVLLNNDTEVLRPEWLSQMVGYLGLGGVGAVGARLLFPDGTVQHAGVIHGLHHGVAGHAFKGLPARDHGYLSYAKVARNYSAVTAACMLVRRDLFLELGGFDAETFAVAYNDADFCYRLLDAGYRIVYCPEAELLHREGASRARTDDPAEPAAFRARYRDRRDRYYNPNLSLDNERFEISSRTLPRPGQAPISTAMCAFNLNWEGAPYSQYELTMRLRDEGVIEPIVYSPMDGPLRSAYEAAGIEVEIAPPPTFRALSLESYERQLVEFVDRLRQWNVELLYANTVQTFYGIDAARRAGLPSIWNPRESEDWRTYFDFLPSDIAARALACFQYPYQVVFVADATRWAWRALDVRRNATTIHNGLDVGRFRKALPSRADARRQVELDVGEIVALCVGTVCERKGQLDIVNAVAVLPESVIRKLRIVIVGDRPGPYSDELRKALAQLEPLRRSRVILAPETPDVAPYYAAADIFVCTSRIESYPRVTLEAMAAGLPMITTPAYGIAEQVQPGANAILYRPGEIRALCRALIELTLEGDVRGRMARNSPLVLASLPDYDEMATSYAALFREAWLSARPRGTPPSVIGSDDFLPPVHATARARR